MDGGWKVKQSLRAQLGTWLESFTARFMGTGEIRVDSAASGSPEVQRKYIPVHWPER